MADSKECEQHTENQRHCRQTVAQIYVEYIAQPSFMLGRVFLNNCILL